ncbi:hypothetical protein E2C01_033369 [Portunus trituberculatus]|uniref:Uncharacterized protein n=1 Tax=Portunus trituberculatus TaxID=210409 RepID=A0A5B7EXP5_PORTR|nr:hypothetical protein [Portunus trituberculatus]
MILLFSRSTVYRTQKEHSSASLIHSMGSGEGRGDISFEDDFLVSLEAFCAFTNPLPWYSSPTCRATPLLMPTCLIK